MILLSFDVEEFDVPDEFGYPILFEEQIEISRKGTHRILDVLEKHQVKATFFITVQFALYAREVVDRIVNDGHEIGSHGFYHSQFSEADLETSRIQLETLGKCEVKGYRMPRMMPVSEEAIKKAGYIYNSSLNPTWVPGRYNNLSKPRTFFYEHDVLQLPRSVTPWFRLPLFWITFHVMPLWLYFHFCKLTLKKDGYLNLYFHPWEFMDLKDHPRFKLPFYITKNSGELLVNRLDQLIHYFKLRKERFGRTDSFIKLKVNQVA